MSAPLVWIVAPGVAGVLLFFLRRWPRLAASAAMAVAGVLALAAWKLSVGEIVSLGLWSFRLQETLFVLGRQFTLGDAIRPILTVIYLMVAFWLGGTISTRAGWAAAPLGLCVVALMTAALAVEPFLYAALLLEMAALVCIPLLASPGKPVGRGILRFITFQTLGMPFLLFTGWLLAGVEADPGNQALVLRVSILLGLGFSFLLAVFPFHTWVPMLAEQSNAYAASFVFLLVPVMVTLFGLGFLERYAWLRNAAGVYTTLRLAGVLMLAAGGLMAAFQRHLGRMMGYGVIGETGFALLALGTEGGLPIYFASLLPRALALGVWSLALLAIQDHAPDLTFHSVKGLARRMPIATACLVLAHLSLAGFPLLGGFPVRLWLWEFLAGQSQSAAIWSLMGSAGLLVGGLRTLAAFVSGSDEGQLQVSEGRFHALLLLIGGLALIVVGVFPNTFLAVLAQIPQVFTHLAP